MPAITRWLVASCAAITRSHSVSRPIERLHEICRADAQHGVIDDHHLGMHHHRIGEFTLARLG